MKKKEKEPELWQCVFNKFLIAFQESLTPFQDLYADESLVYFEGSLDFKWYIKVKGIGLEQSITSFVFMKLNVWVFQVYTGEKCWQLINPNTWLSGK
jgi:hypothetical protein